MDDKSIQPHYIFMVSEYDCNEVNSHIIYYSTSIAALYSAV